jgi:5-(carboxyamino)imidazole ribonucleotide synthase
MVARVGVIGGGQLARMMLPPAVDLGIELRVFAESIDSSAKPAALVLGDYLNLDEVNSFAQTVDVITFDHEHVPQKVLNSLISEKFVVRPGPSALLYAQDKLAMRHRLAVLGIDIPRWGIASDASQVDEFVLEVSAPKVVAKTARGGYDGKGVRFISSGIEILDWLESAQVLLEEIVHFRREVAQLVARRPSGQIVAWPLVETRQKDGVCSEVIAPAAGSILLAGRAREIAVHIAESLDVTGVLAVEMFETEDGRLVVNELAMRPHNSGHIFTELSQTSQFEQHLRAILDWPLGSTSLLAPAGVMVNVFGGVSSEGVAGALEVSSSLKLHHYGKEPRLGRKAGHVSVIGDNPNELLSHAQKAAGMCAIDGVT